MTLQNFTHNPILIKDMRARMRGGRSFWSVTAYLGIISVLVLFVYQLFADQRSSPNEVRDEIGRMIFYTVTTAELLAICVMSPAQTSGAIVSEREQKTFDILRTTTLSAGQLVQGKLFSSVLYIYVLMFVTLPIQSLAFLFGGVTIAEFGVAIVHLAVTAIAFCGLGIFFSSFAKTTKSATSLSQFTSMLVLFGTPLLFFIIAFIDSHTFFGYQLSGRAYSFFNWLVTIINPLVSGIVTAGTFLDNGSLLVTNVSTFGFTNITLPSPWIGYIFLYLFMSFAMYKTTVHIIRGAGAL